MSKLIIANWKSHKTLAEAKQWLEQFQRVSIRPEAHVVIAPPFPFLPELLPGVESLAGVSLGAQTISAFPAGSYTGEVSARNLQSLGVTHVLVGHSERRRHVGETHQEVANQIDQCLQNNLVPVLCVDTDYLLEQARAITSDQLERCVVAYEPVEAIGSGNNVSVDEVAEAKQRIKTVFGEAPVLYGGSVNPTNVDQYLSVVDGFIVGTASLDVIEFMELVQLV